MATLEISEDLLQDAGVGLWEYDQVAGTLTWSAAIYGIFGIDPVAEVSVPEFEIFLTAARDGLGADVFRAAFQSGAPWKAVHRAVTAHGRELWIRSTCRSEGVRGRSLRLTGLIQDITDDAAMRGRDEEGGDLLEEMSALSRIGAWDYDVARNAVRWSRETREIFEADESFEPTPESLKSLFAPGALDVQDDSIAHARAFSIPSDCEYDALTLKGRPIRVRSVCKVVQHEGQIKRLIGTTQDITGQNDAESAHRRTERLLADISLLAGVGGWEVDIATGRIRWTNQLRTIFGTGDAFEPTTELMGQLLSPAGLKLCNDAIRAAVKCGQAFDIEFDAFASDGRELRLRSIGHPENVDGRTVRVVGTLEDVTSLRQAEASRRRYEILHEQVSRLSGIGGWEFDTRTQQTAWSPQVRKIYEVDDAYDPPFEDHQKFVAEESSEAVALARRLAVKEGVPAAIDFKGITATGREIWVRNIYQAERIDGRTVRLYGTAQDVTAERAAKAELDVLHTRLRTALESAGLRVWEIDLERGEVSWDDQHAPTFAEARNGGGIDPESLFSLVHPEDHAWLNQQAKLLRTTGSPCAGRIRVDAGDGTYRHVEIRMCFYPGDASRRTILGISRDVTKEVLLTAEITQKRQEAEQASLAKSQFVARMSHEIRTPMSGVMGMLEVLLRAGLDIAGRAHVETALRSARDLMSVLDDIIDVSRLESRYLSLDPEPFSVVAVVEAVTDLFSTLIREKALTLSVTIEPSLPPWILGDPRRLRQVLTNLVGNAVKFTHSGGIWISVRYDVQREMAFFVVRDTGIGLSEHDARQVFDVFFQADASTTRRFDGSGLGLAIAKQLVGMMGGEIGVTSQLGMGSEFSFSIAAPVVAEPRPKVEDAAAVGRTLRILIAEDNSAMQQILSALLEPAGHLVTVVSDGREAVALAATDRFDVILMDVMMPNMDGPTAAQRIRDLGGRAGGVPIIALTANALVGDRDKYLEAGMTDYLAKPIDVPALFAALARISAKG